MQNNVYCKAGNVELTQNEAFSIYENKQYVVTSTAIYAPHFSTAQNAVYFTKITIIKGLAKRGRHYKLTAEQINHVMGFDYLNI